ncbi:aminotransferase class I/II-fold pyridoxal phosphate-dependent enzyme [Pseudovibrio sp. WM33]|uniref:aminotransferase class I/II-fold pyridoxal phosphate-dependent enzyme n=1 Tax=Pseudovibrio sp. WM33 TaxID=1735585 RepID=UPI0007B2D250|nr:aminotransferase class I/II-fold pyridoxal phosphate-dependent enzyme [Pseudovibrio sp. WM33]KZL24638.1 8-amino-7-oxononanoate synthase [Pseudovibrio sp. WM33]
MIDIDLTLQKQNFDTAIALTTEVVQKHTGYQPDLLTPDAEFETDLGVDSIVQMDIFVELMERCGLPVNGEQLASVVSIRDLTLKALSRLEGRPLPRPQVAELHSKSQPVEELQELIESNASATLEENPSPLTDTRTMRDFADLPNRDLFHKVGAFHEFYTQKRDAGHYWYGMPLESPCQNRAMIYDEVAGKSRRFLMFASNNYLGLANDPRVLEAIRDAAVRYGATNTGCRLIGGSNVLHLELERKLAQLKGTEDSIVFPSGYSANLGTISALLTNRDIVYTDAINHMSIQDGCKLSGAQRRIYKHSLSSLERTLERSADHDGGRLIVSDGVFSMHGDIVDLPRLLNIAKKYDAKLLIDDAHSTGVLGATGSGTSEHFGLKGQIDLELGTFSKTLAGVGGFVAARADVVEYLRFYANSYVFAATIPAHVAAGLIQSIDLMIKEPERLKTLWRNIDHLKGKLLRAGFNLGDTQSAILPIVIGDDQLTLKFGQAVRHRGMFCQTVVFPGVAVGDARLRISVTSEHTVEDLDQAADILIESARETGVTIDE